MTKIARHRQPGDLVTNSQLMAWLKVSKTTVEGWSANGTGPPCIKLGPGRSSPIRWRVSDVESWLDEQTKSPQHDS